MAIDKKLIDQLLTNYKTPGDVIGENWEHGKTGERAEERGYRNPEEKPAAAELAG